MIARAQRGDSRFVLPQPNEVILGKPMKDWLRFSICYWHTFR
jgi:xylose isomerase